MSNSDVDEDVEISNSESFPHLTTKLSTLVANQRLKLPMYQLRVDMAKLRIIMLKEQIPKIYRFFYKAASVGGNNRLNHSPPSTICWKNILNFD